MLYCGGWMSLQGSPVAVESCGAFLRLVLDGALLGGPARLTIPTSEERLHRRIENAPLMPAAGTGHGPRSSQFRSGRPRQPHLGGNFVQGENALRCFWLHKITLLLCSVA